MATFVCDLCKKKLYHKKALEEHYDTHNAKNTAHAGNYSKSQGYYAGNSQQEAAIGSTVINSYGSSGGY